MLPSVDIRTAPPARSMKRSLEEAGPPSPIDMDTPEEDPEEQQQEKKKKRKKKKKRQEGQEEVSQMDVNKEKTKRKRSVEVEGAEVLERETKRRKGGEGVEEDVVTEGDKKKKKKIKKLGEERTREGVEEAMVKEDGEVKKKKKKKKNNNQGEQTIEGVREDVVNESIGVVEENVVNGGEEKKKKKKKKKVVEVTIEVVEESLLNGGEEKKKKKKKKVVEETIEVVEESLVNGGEEKKKKKKKKVVEETIEVVEESLVNGGEEKKKKKKKKVVVETIEGVEENLVNANGEKKKKKVVQPKKKTGTTQEAKKNKKKTDRGQRKPREKVDQKIDPTDLPEDLLHDPEVKEILEYYPGVTSRTVIERLRKYDLHRFREFKKEGVSLRRGRCTVAEKQQIRRNINDLLVLTGISSAQDLFFPQRNNYERAKDIRKLRIQHNFMQRMAEGLYRSCFQVYTQAKRMIDELNHLGRFDEEEVHMLQRLQTRHGNNWAEISKSMNRSVEALQKRFAHIAEKHGVWESDEEERLKKAIRPILKRRAGPHQTGSASGPWLTSEQLFKNLPWTRLSKKVQTRSWTQCREKWATLLKKKMASDQCPAFSGGVKAIRNKVKLINVLYNMDVEDPALIDWDEVGFTIGEVNDRYVQKYFYKLKVTSVPRWSELSYPEIIDFLQEKVLPKLEDHLKEAGETDTDAPPEKYYLSHIFSSGEENSGLTVA